MTDGKWYNGYSPKERDDKFKELKRRIANGELPTPTGPCALCGDPGDPTVHVEFEYHDEDYGEEFIWTEPAMFCLCRNCHRDKLHKRFWRQTAWEAYLAHVRRGGYARELKDPAIKKEVDACRAAIERGQSYSLRELRPYRGKIGAEWFANLRMDEESLRDPKARPRPLGRIPSA